MNIDCSVKLSDPAALIGKYLKLRKDLFISDFHTLNLLSKIEKIIIIRRIQHTTQLRRVVPIGEPVVVVFSKTQ